MKSRVGYAVAFAVLVSLLPVSAAAHCDGLDGPVVKTAKEALAKKDVSLVLPWVGEQDEPAVREAFARTLAVRELSPDARQLADTWLFETVVRLHRAHEGAPFTGLKPAGRDLGPAIPAADAALASGNVDAVVKLVSGEEQKGIRDHFEKMMAAKKAAKPGDVAAGRRFVAEYVSFIHYVERLHQAATREAHGHEEEAASAHEESETGG